MKLDLYKLAEEKNITIIEKLLPDNKRGAAFKKNDRWYITLNRLDTPERKNFTIAHEIAEIELFDRDDITIDEKHRLANIRASQIMLPEEHFKSNVSKFNLLQLKEEYPHASHEVIARKILRFKNSVLTIFDNQAQTLRAGSEGMAFQQNIMPVEKETVRECYRCKAPVIKEDHIARCEAYFIDEDRGIERVILFTEEVF